MKDKTRIVIPDGEYFAIVPVAVLVDEKLGTYERLAYAVLRSFGRDCYAGKAAIAARMGASPRKAQTAIGNLEKAGYIKRLTVPGEANRISFLTKGSTSCSPPKHDVPTPQAHSAPKTYKLNKESKQTPTAGKYSEAFEVFWGEYTNPYGKFEAWKSWQKEGCEGIFADVVEGVEAQKKGGPLDPDLHVEAGTGKSFIPRASTWLNNHRWEDKRPQKGSQECEHPEEACTVLTDYGDSAKVKCSKCGAKIMKNRRS